MRKKILLFSLTVIFSITLFTYMYIPNADAQCVFSPNDLTGKWKANDGGTYYIKHDKNNVWWYGTNSLVENRGFTNVFKGLKIANDINGEWVDVPFGAHSNIGILSLEVDTSGWKLRQNGGGFGATYWYKICEDTRGIPIP